MKLAIHKNIEGFLDYIAIVPESAIDKAQLNKISHANSTKIKIQDTSLPETKYSIVVEIKITPNY